MSNFDDFYRAVKCTWPRYQTSMEDVHGPWLACCHDREPSEVAEAFMLCKKEYPDANKPNWERIIAWLQGQRRWRREQRERLERNGDDESPPEGIQTENTHG